MVLASSSSLPKWMLTMPVLERLMVFVLVVWGTTNILSGSKLLKPLRDWLLHSMRWLGELVDCYMCTGFWVGLSWSFLGLGTCNELRFYPVDLIGLVADGCLASGTTWIIFVVLEKLGAAKL